jgi:hypothetical protein
MGDEAWAAFAIGRPRRALGRFPGSNIGLGPTDYPDASRPIGQYPANTYPVSQSSENFGSLPVDTCRHSPSKKIVWEHAS